MNYQLITEAPAWFLILCFAAGFLYAWLLYRNDSSFSDLKPGMIRLMAFFRFLSVSFLCILLLSPLIKTLFREVEKPIIVVLQDNSQSVVSIRDSANFRLNYPEVMTTFIDELKKNFDVRSFSVGNNPVEDISYSFTDKETDLSSPVNELKARYSGRNLGAVILATDGLYNKGNNPAYAYPELKVPVYTVALGDTSVLKDILISRVNHNKTVFSGNTFPVEITVDARKCGGQSATLSVSKNNTVLFSRKVDIATNRFNMVIPVFLDAKDRGINRYTATITRLDGEVIYDNNSRDFYVEVSDNRQKVLILSNAPHPDIGAIKALLEANINYEVTHALVSEYQGKIQESNLVIMYQLPAVNNPATTILESIRNLELPVLFILGSQTSVTTFNNLNTGIKISDNRNNLSEILPDPNPDFSLFSFDEEYMRRIASFPPLTAPFGNYNVSSNVYPILNQRIGSVKTGMPLLLFSGSTNIKSGVLGGEGIWKWRLHEFADFGNTEAVSSLLLKSVQYLATREQKKPLNLFYKNSYSENETVIFDAEIYNESGELVNQVDVQISFVNDEGKSFPFTFSKTDKAYTLNAGFLPVGRYKFTATSKSGTGTNSESGSIFISALQVELAETIADHEMLQALSEKTGGRLYNPGNLNQLLEELNSSNEIKPVSYSQKRLTDVINLKWIFALLMVLLSIEWFMRKRSGSY